MEELGKRKRFQKTKIFLLLIIIGAFQFLFSEEPNPKTITLQLQWSPQTQFAGYYAAVAKGFYKQEGLDVSIRPGAFNIVPQDVVKSGQAQFCIAWLPKVLVSNEEGADLVNIAQVFQRNGTLEISWKESGIRSPKDWKGKRVGTWGYGNEIGLFAAMRQAGIDPKNPNDVTIVHQDEGMDLFLNGKIDAAQAMIYNEYYQVLTAKNPKTGKDYQPSDLTIISMEKIGTGMPQDGIYARKEWLTESNHEEVAVAFLRASFQGWMYCRNHSTDCVNIVLSVDPKLNRQRMEWMMKEVNGLIWPSPAGIGMMDEPHWRHAAELLQNAGMLKSPPSRDSFRTDLATRAWKP
jgi:NitT/TauT family transport system substrate-binding protein